MSNLPLSTRFLNSSIVENLIKIIPILELHSSEAILNIFVCLAVVVFISYQGLTLLSQVKKKERKEKQELKREQVDTVDRGCEDDSLFTDMHEHLLTEFEIPYHMPVLTDKEGVRNSQLFYEQMKMRRSVRNFSTRPVSLKIIQNLIKTAGCSPSVGNTQPWKFCVIVNEEKKNKIRAILEADERENYGKRMGAGSEWAMDISQLQVTWSRPYITDAPVVLVVCHEIFKEVNDTKQRFFHYNQISTTISVGLLLAAVQNVGLCTVVTSALNAGSKLAKLLRRPDNEYVLLLLPLGYAADDALVPDFKRKPVESITKIY